MAHHKLKFSANTAQDAFLRAANKHNFLLLSAGVGTGKTTGAAIMAWRCATKNPRIPGLIASHKYSHLNTTLIPEVRRVFRATGLYKSEHRTDRVITLINGSTIQYGSADKPDSLDGRNVGWVIGDEIRYWPWLSYQRIVARARIKCPWPILAFLSTPEMNWMYEEWDEKPNRFIVRASTRANLHNLRPGYYEELKRTISPRQFKAYVEGEWVLMSGGVFEDFSASLHLQPGLFSPDLPVDVSVDPGVRKAGVVFVQHHRWCLRHNEPDCVHIIDEIMPDNRPTVHIARDLVELYSANRWRRGKLYIDPAGASRSIQVGYSDVDILQSAGFECVYTTDPESRYIPNGIDVIRSKVKNVDEHTSLYIADHLVGSGHERGIVKALSRSTYGEEKRGRPVSNHPIEDEFKHALDACRYYLVNKFPPIGGRVELR